MIISDTAIRNRVAVFVLMVLIGGIGVYSYISLPREAFPEVQIPMLVVTTVRDGVSPADMESSVTMKIEKFLTGLGGVKEIRSTSAIGMSMITIEFLPEVKVDEALQRVRDKVSQARAELPDDVKEPIISEINFSDIPIMIVNMSGKVSPVTMKTMADDLKDEIETIPGVMNCTVLGALEREIRLEIDQERVAAFGLTISELMALIPSENVNISAGGLETPCLQFNIRVPAEFAKPQEVDKLLLTTRNGMPIYLTDVATVRDTFKDRTTYSRVNGAESVTLSIQKRLGGNIVEIADRVKAVLAEAQKMTPAGTKFDVTMDFSKNVRRMVGDLENHILSGLVLVLIVLLVFLGWRASLIVAVAIPLSLMISFGVLQYMGYTLNMIVLFSLIMVLGMLVDDAIVIVENVWRHMQMGYGRLDAAILGTREVAWPVITSTATKIAAFAPMAFWPGMMGSFMKYLPITLVVTLSSSLFVAMVINPVFCAVFGGKEAHRKHDPLLMRGYRRLLELVMHHRAVALTLSVLLLIGLTITYGKFGHGVEFFPEADPEMAIINIRCPQGTNIHETDRLAKVVEQRIEKYKRYMDYVVTNVGSSGSVNPMMGGAGGSHIANLTLVFPDFDKREILSAEIVKMIRRDIADIPGAEIKVEKQKNGPQTGAPVTVEIVGKDFDQLKQISSQSLDKIKGVPNLVNLRSDYEAAMPELAFRADRQGAVLRNVNTQVIGNYLRTSIYGTKVGTYRQFNDEYDITVRLPEGQRNNVENLFAWEVPNTTGAAVPLSSLGEFHYTGGLGTINRLNQKRVVTLTADNEGRSAQEVLADVQGRLATQKLPMGYEIRYAGEKEEQEKAGKFLFMQAAPVALLLIFLVLVLEFNTLSVPVIIMSTVVLSLIGVFVGLLTHGMPFGIIMTGVGVISLTGVVVANGIVLLDFARKLQKTGMEVTRAAIQASATRLRPVFLTAVTAILGLLPMATGISYNFRHLQWETRSETSQWWASMAIAVIYGLSFATVLTLVVVPALYASTYRLLSRFGLGGLKQKQEQPLASGSILHLPINTAPDSPIN